MGRPRIDKEHKLSEVVVFRLTEDELKRLEGYSQACGQAVGVVVRTKLFTGAFPKPLTPKADRQLYTELNRIGNNINQLTRRANGGFLPKDDTRLLLQVLGELSAQQQAIIGSLLDGGR